MSSIHVLRKALACSSALCLTSALVWADSISPASVSASLNVGESITVAKTVTISAGLPTSARVDVFFLADTTGSMGTYLTSVRNNIVSIMNAVSPLGDVAFAVGNYKDYPISPYGSVSDYPYRLDAAMTTNTAAVQAAMGTWTASGGNDWPESQFAALEALSGSQAAAVGWRTGSERMVVWFGDAEGHDTTPGELSFTATGTNYPGPTQAVVIASLNAHGVSVEAVNAAGAGAGLDFRGQASEIAAATGGHIYNNTSSAGIVSVIQNAITASVSNYTNVALDLSEAPSGVGVVAVPGSFTGSYDRSIDRTFNFEVTFTGITPGLHSFNIYATVDGGRVATEADRITVGGAPSVPDSGSSLALFGLGLAAIAVLRRKFNR